MNCIICQNYLSGRQKKFCSDQCRAKDSNVHSYKTLKIRGLSRKKQLVKQLGGGCSICGYKKNLSALCFHHKDPKTKLLKLDMRTLSTRSWDVLSTEATKCLLLCSNCHMETHYPYLAIN